MLETRGQRTTFRKVDLENIYILVLRNKLKEERSVRDFERNRTDRINTLKGKFLDWLIRYSLDNVPMAVLILQRMRT